MQLKTNYKIECEAINVFYIPSMEMLCVNDVNDQEIEITSISTETMILMVRNMFCSRDVPSKHDLKAMDLRHIREIYESLEKYLSDEED